MYFANSGGLVQGWDISGLKQGKTPTRVFRFWTGDDTDASVVIDEDGFLYVGVGVRARKASGRSEVGQIMKLDPRKPDNPLVWSVQDHGAVAVRGLGHAGHRGRDMVYVAHQRRPVARASMPLTGKVQWQKKLPGADLAVTGRRRRRAAAGATATACCTRTTSDKPGIEPKELWKVTLGGCIESTPAVWKGRIYVGTRAGRFFAIG